MLFIVQRREHDYRQGVAIRLLLYLFHDVVAVHVWQHHVAHEQGRLFCQYTFQSLLAVAVGNNLEEHGEFRTYLVEHVRIVFYHSHRHIVQCLRQHLLDVLQLLLIFFRSLIVGKRRRIEVFF